MRILIENRFEFVFSLLILSLPFSNAIPNIFFAILLIMTIIDYKKIAVKDLNFTFKLLDLLLIFLMLKSLFFGFFLDDFTYYRFFLIIILISIIFLRVKKIRILKQAILLSINIALLFSLYKIAIYYFNYKYLPFNDGWAVNKILVLERPYAGFFSLISVIISLELYKNGTSKKALYLLSFFSSIIFLFIISARISILSTLLILILYILFYEKKGIKYKTLIIFISISILGLTFFLNQNLTKRFFLRDSFQTSYSIAKNSEPRVVIWDCVKKMTSSKDFNNLIGNPSYKEIYLKLTNLYQASINNVQKRMWFLNQQYNTHNQFIDIYMIGGLISLSVFILFIITSIYISRDNFFGLSIMIALTLFLMVENLFQRQFGVYTFTLTYCFYFSEQRFIGKKNKINEGKKIKIAHILHSVGGVDVSLRLITENIDSDKFENIVIHGVNDTSNPFFDKQKKIIKSYKTPIYREINFFQDLKATIQTYKILKKEQPDLIHAHSAKGGIIGRVLGFFLKTNILYTPQAFSFLSAENKLKRNIYIFIERLFANKFSYLLASSNSEKERGIKNKIYKREKTLLYNNSINDILETEKLSIKVTWPKEYICTVGRPSYQKHIELMIDVLHEVNKKKEVHLVIMGVGFHSDKLEEVKEKIIKYNLSDKVTLIDWTQRNDIFNIIEESKIYISTARYEGLPYSIIESLALSTPCIVTDSDGNRDLIKENYNGYVIKNENIHDFKEKIIFLLNNEEERKKFSINSRKEFVENYDVVKNIKILEKIYQKHSKPK